MPQQHRLALARHVAQQLGPGDVAGADLEGPHVRVDGVDEVEGVRRGQVLDAELAAALVRAAPSSPARRWPRRTPRRPTSSRPPGAPSWAGSSKPRRETMVGAWKFWNFAAWAPACAASSHEVQRALERAVVVGADVRDEVRRVRRGRRAGRRWRGWSRGLPSRAAPPGCARSRPRMAAAVPSSSSRRRRATPSATVGGAPRPRVSRPTSMVGSSGRAAVRCRSARAMGSIASGSSVEAARHHPAELGLVHGVGRADVERPLHLERAQSHGLLDDLPGSERGEAHVGEELRPLAARSGRAGWPR